MIDLTNRLLAVEAGQESRRFFEKRHGRIPLFGDPVTEVEEEKAFSAFWSRLATEHPQNPRLHTVENYARMRRAHRIAFIGDKRKIKLPLRLKPYRRKRKPSAGVDSSGGQK